jgi:uncharacterized tellurite resistance protein B-like protein
LHEGPAGPKVVANPTCAQDSREGEGICYAFFMVLRWLFGDSTSSAPTASGELLALVKRFMPAADADGAAIVGAVAGLLASVAHADRVYGPEERAHVQDALGRMPGLTPEAVAAVCELLDTRLADLAHESLQTYTRVLYERLERHARFEVLEVLMDLAAADELLTMDETALLRRVTRGLGLSDQEYLASQERHRERLSVLKPS